MVIQLLLLVSIVFASENALITTFKPQKDVSASSELANILIVTTLDGQIHGVDRTTGDLIWTQKETWGPLVQLKHDSNDKLSIENDGIFIPEPIGDGNLYFYTSGQPLKQLPFSLKQIVNQSPVRVSNGMVYTTQKLSRLISLNPLTGEIVGRFGDDTCQPSDYSTSSIHLARTDYHLLIQGLKSNSLKWKISYGDYSSGELVDPSAQIRIGIDGFLEYRRLEIEWNLKLESLVTTVFHLKTSADLNEPFSLEKVFPLDSAKSNEAILGNFNGNPFILSKFSFQKTESLSRDLSVKCSGAICPDSVHFIEPMKEISYLEAPPQQKFPLIQLIATVILVTISATFYLNSLIPTFKSLQVTSQVLGYGSHGTVVLKGYFEQRQVAVKRMLLDYYELAHHEVQALQDSDHHPNVIRYFCKEESGKFLYIALELCPCSLFDLIGSDDFIELKNILDHKQVVNEVAQGIQHLHKLKIVHRDLKPQNILVKQSAVTQKLTVLISDFGLSKRLEHENVSFTFQKSGTLGWRAPECINSSKVSMAIDIFSAGLLFYYILSNGKHAFGNDFERETNILKNEYCISALESMQEAKDLIEQMIQVDPLKRPNADKIVLHPFFWSHEKKMSFLQDVSDRFESESRDPPSFLQKKLESKALEIIGTDWTRKIDKVMLDNMTKYRKYDTDLIRDLLRAIRNKKHHYQDQPLKVRVLTNNDPVTGVLTYFTTRFPLLFMHVYHLTKEHLSKEPLFSSYF